MADGDDDTDRQAADLAREIRNGRGFSMADALGRLAGPGAMKGGSPIPLQRQAMAVIEAALERHLEDRGGILRRVLAREVANGGHVLADPGRPLAALAAELDHLLASAPLLAELVRASDEEWGRELGERPFFAREGHPDHPDDPYTPDSVRSALVALRAALP